MRFSAVSVLAMASTVSAHARMYGVWVNGEDQGNGQNVYIRTPPSNSPVKDLSSADIVCNVNGGTAAPEFVSAAAGDTLSFEWYHDNRNDDIIDKSHQGPIITYIAPYTETDGTGAIWTKIQEEGYDGSKWAVDNLIANGGKIDFDLPAGLKAGKYLIRQEIIAHHESDATYDQNPARGAQFYPSCVQVEVTGSGSAVPDEGFDFNTGYKYSDAGIHFNLYGSYSSYEIPGPAVWSGSSTGSGSSSGSSGSSPSAPAAPAPAATSAAPVATAPAATQPAAGGSDDSQATQAPAPVATLSTVVRPESPSATQAEPAPVSTTAPKTGCGSRRRRRSARKVAKRNVM
ncbi:hypothetical protein CEP52_002769 [Fusarium oligoseptatum]|uniref:lytic cellulose monooxygenase (C4-dehydrogenating) n=1 Tax=Fusarium oligoseptatum TaxID=2604345 RepID=A0A428UC20_9HYPO|nr:hypothetical protein CEP52_002769 [Fusarium oligoseptatum]